MATSQQSSAQEVADGRSSRLWFAAEIQHMMYGFGDCSKPLIESASLIEDIVFQQMTQLLYKVEEIAHKRNARFIGIEDFLFLLRKNKLKLHRLLRFLEFKDQRYSMKSASAEDDEASVEETKQLHVKKRRKICQDFLNAIDQTGELIALLDETEEDEIKRERRMRAEVMTRNMTTQEYLEYCEARQASFAPRYKLPKFKDWVLSGVTLDVKPNPYALEILSYFAYETVAEIVDLALIVKRDKNISISDPFSNEIAPVCSTYTPCTYTGKSSTEQTTPLFSPGISSSSTSTCCSSGILLSPQPTKVMSGGNSANNGQQTSLFGNSVTSQIKAKKKKVISQQSKDLIASQAITPADIYEALRRYCQPNGPFADFSKLPLLGVGKRLLCC